MVTATDSFRHVAPLNAANSADNPDGTLAADLPKTTPENDRYGAQHIAARFPARSATSDGASTAATTGSDEPSARAVTFDADLLSEVVAGSATKPIVTTPARVAGSANTVVTKADLASVQVQAVGHRDTSELRHCGAVPANETWTADKVHVLAGEVRVPTGRVLTVAPGAVVRSDGAGLTIAGSLVANGTTARPVVFTSSRDVAAIGHSDDDAPSSAPAAGDWTGISARGAARFSLNHANIRYARWGLLGTELTAPVEVINSSIQDIDGPGLALDTSKAITVSGNTVVRTVATAISVTQRGTAANVGASSTTVSNNRIDTVTGDFGGQRGISVNVAPTVGQTALLRLPAPTVANNKVKGVFGESNPYDEANGVAIQVTSHNLLPARLTGNTGTGNTMNSLMLTGTLRADLTLPVAGLPITIGGYSEATHNALTVGAGVTLTVTPGTVVKFDGNTYGGGSDRQGLNVAGTLIATGTDTRPITFTSLRDDTAGGDTNGDGNTTTPTPGTWTGINAGTSSRVTLDEVVLRYADVALTVTGDGRVEVHGAIRDSMVGIRADAYVDATGVDWDGDPTGPAPFGDGPAVEGTAIEVAPWVGWVPAPAPQSTPPGTSPTDDGCRKVMFLAVRGSSEDPYESAADSDYNNWLDGFGPRVWQIYEAFNRGLDDRGYDHRADQKGVGLRYLALHVPYMEDGEHLHDVAIGAALNGAAYTYSIWQGVFRMRQYLRDEMQTCGASQKYVLSGYSQGALAIHIYLNLLATPAELSRISAVGLLADPAKNGSGDEHVFTNGFEPADATHNESVKRASGVYRKMLIPTLTGLQRLPGSGPLPPSIAGRTGSLCRDHDVVCAPGWGADGEVHGSYSSAELASFGDWLANIAIAHVPAQNLPGPGVPFRLSRVGA